MSTLKPAVIFSQSNQKHRCVVLKQLPITTKKQKLRPKRDLFEPEHAVSCSIRGN